MMTHILSNLPEEYQTIVKVLEDEVDDDNDPLTIERIHDKLLVRYDQKNEQLWPITSSEYEKPLYLKSKYKVTCINEEEFILVRDTC